MKGTLRRSMGELLLPAVIAAVVAVVATVLAQRLVAPALVARGGWASRWDQSFVGMIGALAFFLAFYVAYRLMRTPRREERSWILRVGQVAPTTASYREAGMPAVQDLIDRLHRRGYQLEARQVDEAQEPHGAADPRAPLAGARFDLRDLRLPAGTRVVVHVSGEATGASGGPGTVTAIEGGRKLAGEELALFTIVELAALLPGLEYKDMDSALTPDTTEMLAATLPERPRAL